MVVKKNVPVQDEDLVPEVEPVVVPEKTPDEIAREAFEALASVHGETVGEIIFDKRSGNYNAEFLDSTGNVVRTIARRKEVK